MKEKTISKEWGKIISAKPPKMEVISGSIDWILKLLGWHKSGRKV